MDGGGLEADGEGGEMGMRKGNDRLIGIPLGYGHAASSRIITQS